MTPPPPLTALADLQPQLASAGFAVLDAASLSRWTGAAPADLQALQAFWDDLPTDNHLRDGGRYRRRRHSCFTVAGERIVSRLRRDLFSALLRQETAFFDERRTGELTSRLAADTTVLQNAVTVNISMLLRFGVMGIGAVVLLAAGEIARLLAVQLYLHYAARAKGEYGSKV
jgi:hypothetical protein